MRHGHARFGPCACQAHHMFRSDIGSKNGGPDNKPAHIPAGKEIVFGVFVLLGDNPACHGDQGEEINGKDNPVRGFKYVVHIGYVGYVGSRFRVPGSRFEHAYIMKRATLCFMAAYCLLPAAHHY